MFLVDSRFDLRNESYHHSALDREMSAMLILDLSEKEKQLQYNQVLQRYRINFTNLESVVNEPVKCKRLQKRRSSRIRLSK